MDFWFVLIILYIEILINFVCKTISIGFWAISANIGHLFYKFSKYNVAGISLSEGKFINCWLNIDILSMFQDNLK